MWIRQCLWFNLGQLSKFCQIFKKSKNKNAKFVLKSKFWQHYFCKMTMQIKQIVELDESMWINFGKCGKSMKIEYCEYWILRYVCESIFVNPFELMQLNTNIANFANTMSKITHAYSA